MAQDLCALLREKKLISIVRGAPTEKITKIADAIYRGGFRFMEITFDQSGKIPHAVTAEQIRTWDDQVRRAAGMGHLIALTGNGETAQDTAEQLRQGQRALERGSMVRQPTRASFR